MELKDYYTILELKPSASHDEIKKSYRRLAQLYHPDKNSNDPYAAVQFSAIKEAYETLTNPMRKDAYLQQRWYAKSMGRNTNGTGIVTPVIILKQLLELEKYTRTIDTHRMDNVGLSDHLNDILSSENIELLNKFNDKDTNKEIAFSAMRIIEIFQLEQVLKFKASINSIRCDDELVSTRMEKMISDKMQQDYWNRRQTILIAITVLLICVIIYFTARP